MSSHRCRCTSVLYRWSVVITLQMTTVEWRCHGNLHHSKTTRDISTSWTKLHNSDTFRERSTDSSGCLASMSRFQALLSPEKQILTLKTLWYDSTCVPNFHFNTKISHWNALFMSSPVSSTGPHLEARHLFSSVVATQFVADLQISRKVENFFFRII